MNFHRNNFAGRVSICTLGCKVNQYESSQMQTLLENGGYDVTMGDREGADLYIVNTCTVTGSTDSQSRQLVNSIIRLNPEAPVLVTGCYAQIAPDVFRSIKGVTSILGRAEMGSILKRVDHFLGRPHEETGESDLEWAVPSFSHRTRPFIKVQDGCNSGCSYCIIPKARGPSRSRNPESIIREVQTMASRGHREVVITGIHLGHYGLDLDPRQSLEDLINRLGDQGGVSRLRISSLEPTEVSPAIMNWFECCLSACPHLHVSLQSGDNEVLRKMNRRYSTEQFRDMVREVTGRVPDMAIGVDVIGGFPGEDKGAFQRTYSLLENLPLAYFHVFPFSPRPGTPAARLRPVVKAPLIRRRCEALRALGKKKKEVFARRFIGRRFPVLVESKRDSVSGMLKGFTPNYIPVRFQGPDDWMNREIGVVIKEVRGTMVFGSPDEKSLDRGESSSWMTAG